MSNIQWAQRIGRRIKLRDLHVLLAAVEAGSMAKAAQRLAVSQPVVSQAIADLEHTLGVRLVDRHRRGIEPTLYGRALLNHGLAAFDALRQGVKELEFLADPGVGELRIGCPEWITAGLLPIIIDELVKAHPRLGFHVLHTIPATSEFRELRQRTIDIVLGRIAQPFEEEDLEAEVLYQEELAIVAGATSPWAKRRKIDLAELVNERWILLPQNEFPGLLVANAFRSVGLTPPRATISAFSIHMRDRLLATGRYLSVVPNSVLHFAGDRLSFKALPVELEQWVQPRPVAVVTLRNRTLSPVARLFIEHARRLTRSLARQSSRHSNSRPDAGAIAPDGRSPKRPSAQQPGR